MTAGSQVIRGTVQDPDGKAIGGAAVYFIGGPVPLPDIAAMTDSQGSFALSAPVAGSYRIGCTAAGFHPIETTVNVTPSKPTPATITLEAEPESGI